MSAMRMARFDTPDAPPHSALDGFRPLILGQRAAHLKEEPPFGTVLERMGDDQQPNPGSLKFLSEEELMPEVTREPIGIDHHHRRDGLGRDQVTQAPQAWPVQRRAGDPLIDQNMAL